jgi:predicted nucleic acid-binding protein
MIAYVDSSVVLRIVLGQPERLKEWKSIERGVTSGLLEAECLRTLDRLRFRTKHDPEDFAARRAAVFRILERLEVVDVSPYVLRRAAQPMPGPLGTLDAIHLATAQLWRDLRSTAPVIATHDRELGLAAQADGFRVVGCTL